MHNSPVLTVYQHMEGEGQAYINGVLLTPVFYRLKEVEESSLLTSNRYPSVQPRGAIYGTFYSKNASLLAGHVGERITLRLANGQHIDVTVVKNLADQSCLVQGLPVVS